MLTAEMDTLPVPPVIFDGPIEETSSENEKEIIELSAMSPLPLLDLMPIVILYLC
jgi:hypothetical protein